MNTDKIYAEQIANQYAEKETSKVKSLKRLDKKAKEPARIFALTFGIISSLVMGTGMSLAMGVIGGGTVLMTVRKTEKYPPSARRIFFPELTKYAFRQFS
jgi:hypothetical protein